jgi:hypothetical protein
MQHPVGQCADVRKTLGLLTTFTASLVKRAACAAGSYSTVAAAATATAATFNQADAFPLRAAGLD